MDPASAINLFDVGEYPVGVTVREDVQSILDLAEGDETIPEMLDRIKEEDQDAAYNSLVRQYQAMEEARNEQPEVIESIQPRRKPINVLRSLGIGGIFDG